MESRIGEKTASKASSASVWANGCTKVDFVISLLCHQHNSKQEFELDVYIYQNHRFKPYQVLNVKIFGDKFFVRQFVSDEIIKM